jgi:2-polyprenyl-3-methyl-5-hydroxy-6-metoxy-1,4-benzoquinol methylase
VGCRHFLDVIEHLPDDLQAVRQAGEALKPGGYLFIITPVFSQFWTYNDDMAQHLRRYRLNDFV